MPVFSFHLTETSLGGSLNALLSPPSAESAPGLIHAECMTVMALGSPIASAGRMQLRQLAVFASWKAEAAIDAFLSGAKLGRALAAGWHVRLELLRRWGHVSEFDESPTAVNHAGSNAPVVAVTLARLKLSQLARFIRWGKPVEALVRDHPGQLLALAAIRLPRTFSTFSVWQSQRAMTDMVYGRDSVPGAQRHAAAMAERSRKDFHDEFTTLRFRALSEHGAWQGQNHIIPPSAP